jgi:hypothetical protein
MPDILRIEKVFEAAPQNQILAFGCCEALSQES